MFTAFLSATFHLSWKSPQIPTENNKWVLHWAKRVQRNFLQFAAQGSRSGSGSDSVLWLNKYYGRHTSLSGRCCCCSLFFPTHFSPLGNFVPGNLSVLPIRDMWPLFTERMRPRKSLPVAARCHFETKTKSAQDHPHWSGEVTTEDESSEKQDKTWASCTTSLTPAALAVLFSGVTGRSSCAQPRLEAGTNFLLQVP